MLRDAGSLNGTYVNRERIEEAVLAGGDEVQIGKFKLVYLIAGEDEWHTADRSSNGTQRGRQAGPDPGWRRPGGGRRLVSSGHICRSATC